MIHYMYHPDKLIMVQLYREKIDFEDIYQLELVMKSIFKTYQNGEKITCITDMNDCYVLDEKLTSMLSRFVINNYQFYQHIYITNMPSAIKILYRIYNVITGLGSMHSLSDMSLEDTCAKFHVPIPNIKDPEQSINYYSNTILAAKLKNNNTN